MESTVTLSGVKPYYQSDTGNNILYHGDCMELLPLLNGRVDVVFADPPYFLSNGGFSVQSGKIVSVNKGEWDKGISIDDMYAFNMKWIGLCREVLTNNGTIWVSGTYHNIFSVANALASLGFKILNVITWAKTNPPPNISCRYFTYSTEFIIWARKKEKVAHYYNYELMKHINDDKQMTDVWRLPAIAPWEKSCGKHPTQKPLGLLSRIIMASTQPGAWILDPFAGSSTTGIAANLLGRRFLGIEKECDFAAISKARREEIENVKTFATYKKKVADIVKAENTQTDCFMCTEPSIEPLPFLGKELPSNEVLMYAVSPVTRKKTETVGKLALGIKDCSLVSCDISNIGYIMFHYWNNEKATPYKLLNAPKLIKKQDIPDGYLLRMVAGAENFLLLEYDTSEPACIGNFDIKRVMRKGRNRYIPFVTSLDSIQYDNYK